jgi:hypothetical protein
MNPIVRLPSLLLLCAAFVLASGLAWAQPRTPFAPSLLLDAAGLADRELPARAVEGSGLAGRVNPAAIAGARLRIELSDGRVLVAERRSETAGSGGERSWVGEFEGQPGSVLSLTRYRGQVSGFAHHGAEIWEIEAIGPGRSRLYRVDEGRLPPEGPVLPPPPDVGGEAAPITVAVATAETPVVQDLLIVYTAGAVGTRSGATAEEKEASLRSAILAAVTAANTAYANSLIGLRLNLVGLEPIAYTETGDMGVALSRLRSTADGFMDEVHVRRNELGADLVALITSDTNYCGIAYVMTSASASFASSAFSVTAPGCLSGHTLAHELGHNQGNAHDRANASGTYIYPYSYGYRTCDNPDLAGSQAFRTVMAYSCTGTPRVNHFSNPNVLYNGVAQTGIDHDVDPARSADNARSMNATAPVTAAFRSGPAGTVPTPPDGLSGSATAFDRAALAWTDRSGDETGFVMQRASGGGSFADRATLAANVTAYTDTGFAGATTYSYRVRAFNSAGSSIYSNTVTVTTPAAPPPPAAPSPASLTIVGSVVTLGWANVAGESGYEVRRETLGSKNRWTGTTIAQPGADVTTVSDSPVSGTHRYTVRAVNAAGASGYVNASCTGQPGCSADGWSFAITSSGGGGKGGGRK